MIRVALDAMGADGGPAVTVEGAARLSLEPQSPELLLVGDLEALSPLLSRQRYDPRKLALVHAPRWVKQDGEARDCTHPQSSMQVASQLVAEGEAQALVSAGHTGGLILSCAQAFERIPGIRRAALAAVYPTERGHGPHEDPFALILDVGATLHASAEDLVGFAQMGVAYAEIISQNPHPSVALLSNGSEPEKGTREIVEAHAMLSQWPGLHFQGNIEGLDIPRGVVDVVVCEGFLGNVVLKMLEGISEVVTDLAQDAHARRFLWKLGLTMLSEGIRQIRTLTDWREYGGAPILGFNQVIIKAHGRSNSRAIRNAVQVAAKAVRGDLTGRIQQRLARSPWAERSGTQ